MADLRLEFTGAAEVEIGGGDLGPDWEGDVIQLDCFGVRLCIEFTDDAHLRDLASLCNRLLAERIEERQARRALWRKTYPKEAAQWDAEQAAKRGAECAA